MDLSAYFYHIWTPHLVHLSPDMLLLRAGITHWQSPNFFAYFPSNSSFPAMLGDMLSTAFSTVGFCWISSPATTELETVRIPLANILPATVSATLR